MRHQQKWRREAYRLWHTRSAPLKAAHEARERKQEVAPMLTPPPRLLHIFRLFFAFRFRAFAATPLIFTLLSPLPRHAASDI
jgi:hypothetical protein